MKITLISLSPSTGKMIGYGVRLLSACLKKEGHDVLILFLPIENYESVEEKILENIVQTAKDSNLIGISLMTDNFKHAVQLNAHLKNKIDVPIIWGGIHPTIEPQECLNYTEMVCIGEGEKSIVELAERIENNKAYHNIPGIWINKHKKIIKNALPPLSNNLDKIPFQDIDHENHYILLNGSISKVNKEVLEKSLQFFVTFASRGCPFSCTYCWNNTIKKIYPNKNIVRQRSTDNVIKELILIKRKLPYIKVIHIDDDSFFNRSEKEIYDFAQKYKENIDLPLWITGAHPTTLTREKLSALTKAKIRSLTVKMGIQTGSKRIKKLYRRNYSNDLVHKAVGLLNEFNGQIKTPQYDFILDNPWETERDIIETLRMIAKFPTPFTLPLFPLTFYPGTDLYEKAKKEGLIHNQKNTENIVRSHKPQNTFLNNLFYLMNDYASKNMKISSFIIFMLTNPLFRSIKVSQFIYNFLNNKIQLIKNSEPVYWPKG